jgi:hypothetical protein
MERRSAGHAAKRIKTADVEQALKNQILEAQNEALQAGNEQVQADRQVQETLWNPTRASDQWARRSSAVAVTTTMTRSKTVSGNEKARRPLEKTTCRSSCENSWPLHKNKDPSCLPPLFPNRIMQL